jgi:hypothetical protein
LVCAVTAIFRFILSLYVVEGTGVPTSIDNAALVFNIACTMLQLVSGLILFRALYNFRKEIDLIPSAKQKTGSQIIQFCILMVHIVTLSVEQYYILRCFANSTT